MRKLRHIVAALLIVSLIATLGISTFAEEKEVEKIYCPQFANASVAVFDVATGTVTKEITVGSEPNSATLSLDGSKVYVSNRSSYSISVIDVATDTVAETISLDSSVTGPIMGITMDGKGENLYVSCNNCLLRYNLENKTKEVLIQDNFFNCVVFGDILYAVTYYSGMLYVYDLKNDTLLNSKQLEYATYVANISPDGKKLAISTFNGDPAIIYDTETKTISEIEDSSNVYYLDFSKDGKYIYYAGVNQYFYKYEIATKTTTSCDLGNGITYNYTFGLSNDGKTAYILSYSGNALVVVDIPTMIATKTVQVNSPYVAGGFMLPTALIEEREELSKADYEIKETGADATWTQGSKDGLTLTSSADFDKFESVSVDGAVLDASNYTVAKGSTKVTFNEDYLATLSVGDHEVIITSTDGTAKGTLTIAAKSEEPKKEEPKKETPKKEEPKEEIANTADNSAIGAFVALSVIGAAGFVSIKKKEN